MRTNKKVTRAVKVRLARRAKKEAAKEEVRAERRKQREQKYLKRKIVSDAISSLGFDKFKKSKNAHSG